jgi:integrase
MPAQKRHKTKYPGVYFIKGITAGTGKTEKIYYIMYRKNGKQIHEKAGRQFKDDMTPARAAVIRSERMTGRQASNKARREAEKAEKEAESKRWTISRLWETYKENRPDLKGIVTDQNRFENYIDPAFGSKEPLELISLDVDRLRIKLLKTKSPGTVKNVLELLRRIVNFGIKKGLCIGPNFRIELPRVNNEKTEDLSPEQLQSLLKAIDEDSNTIAGNMMKMALYTGMRRGELFKLRWKDIDFERGFIELIDPKGGPDQKIPLNETARKMLENHPKTQSAYVFPGRGGRRRTDINHQVSRIRDAAGLPKGFRPLHSLRHVYASMLASSGQVDMYTLQKLLTHKSPMMTQRYAHLRDEALKRAAELAGSIIEKASGERDKIMKIKNN